MNGSHRVLHLQLISFFKGVVVVVVVVVIVKMEKSTNAGWGMEGTQNSGQPKGRDVLLNMNRLLSCECF